LLHLKFDICPVLYYQAVDGQTEVSWVFNFMILSNLQNSQNLMHTKMCLFYSNQLTVLTTKLRSQKIHRKLTQRPTTKLRN